MILHAGLGDFQIQILEGLEEFPLIVPAAHSFYLHELKPKLLDVLSHLKGIYAILLCEIIYQSKPYNLDLIVTNQMLILQVTTILPYQCEAVKKFLQFSNLLLLQMLNFHKPFISDDFRIGVAFAVVHL